MKVTYKLIALAIAAGTLAGCSTTPATQLSDAQLCTELGAASADGDSSRLYEVLQEGKQRENLHTLTLDQQTCETLANTGALERQNYRAQQRAAGQMLMAYGQQQQQQAAQQDAYNQQMLNQQAAQAQQNMNAWQQRQALNNIAGAIRGQGY